MFTHTHTQARLISCCSHTFSVNTSFLWPKQNSSPLSAAQCGLLGSPGAIPGAIPGATSGFGIAASHQPTGVVVVVVDCRHTRSCSGTKNDTCLLFGASLGGWIWGDNSCLGLVLVLAPRFGATLAGPSWRTPNVYFI